MAVLELLGALAFLAGGATLMLAGAATPYLGIIFMALGAVLLIVGLFEFLLFWGLWTLKPWARKMTMIFAIISILIGIVQLVTGGYGGIVGVLLNVIIMYYLTRPEVKAAFGGPPAMGGA